MREVVMLKPFYTEAVLKFQKLNTQSRQRGAVVQGRSLLPYRLRYMSGTCKIELSGYTLGFPFAIYYCNPQIAFCRVR
ncbi:MAG: hypothetical protein LBK06_05570 [Planctomycetaceae bacterium]|nr:hypothetical protein [Planctomycetaceae bacterium]